MSSFHKYVELEAVIADYMHQYCRLSASDRFTVALEGAHKPMTLSTRSNPNNPKSPNDTDDPYDSNNFNDLPGTNSLNDLNDSSDPNDQNNLSASLSPADHNITTV